MSSPVRRSKRPNYWSVVAGYIAVFLIAAPFLGPVYALPWWVQAGWAFVFGALALQVVKAVLTINSRES